LHEICNDKKDWLSAKKIVYFGGPIHCDCAPSLQLIRWRHWSRND